MHLLGAAIGWGAQKTKTELGPEVFFKDISLKKLKLLGVNFKCEGVISPSISVCSGEIKDKEQRSMLVKEFVARLTERVQHLVKHEKFPVVIGGDHSMAMGTWSGLTTGLNAEGQFGLIWFDAHMDAHLKETSPSLAYHGMPLARLLGQGRQFLVELGSGKVKLNPKHVCLIGIRSYEEGEKSLLESLGVRVFYMDEIQRRGLDAVFDEALNIVKNGTKGFGLSVDLDGFDPKDAPATGSLEKGGVSKEDALRNFAKLSKELNFKALEIAEYNPTLKGAEQTLTLMHEIIAACEHKKGNQS